MVGYVQVHGQEYEVLVVDTAGQDEYSIFPTQVITVLIVKNKKISTKPRSIQYSVDIDGYVMVYSIDNQKSFEVPSLIVHKYQLPLSAFQVVKVIYEKLVDLTGNPAVPLVLVSILVFINHAMAGSLTSTLLGGQQV